ncbi:endonuclease MutS2 [Brevibacillus formosus]|uniref:endonuclease MutS2 n=1 Tax=Brevibacillus TaxID=55080 RepID=UPI000D0EFB8B|nr:MULTISPECIES: endonuclease MutS2 [Brevibacillus]MBG9944115.1 recombination and DNA strand exchange inhibitor protein [Brevibacillus formosus]MED1945993.1 endonuclease MutS2 [Brevibacillus formosus]MED1997816.1 endonuclease MutS2 [Brevibacillus formosus]MED2083858.1 endonuclease MutS2 [Brevibacillus formosus]PSK17908.1 endonuclease MutS2 [Brevibacillus sp. NRRL NRS-603]
MEQRVLKTLEYDKIVALLIDKASCTYGKEKAAELVPFLRLDEVITAQQGTEQAATVLRLKGSVPLGGIRDIRGPVQRARLNAMLAPMELLDIASTVMAGRRLKTFLLDMCEDHELPLLQQQAERIEGLRELETEIRRCIDENGDILDSASLELRQVRQEIRQLESRIREKLDQMTRSSTYQKMLMENIVTIRGDRFVIPVKQEYRSVFGGIVHDQSASGATLFIEPEVIVEMNNKLRELRLREEREVERILYVLTEQVSFAVEALVENTEALTELDFMFAKAQLAWSMKAICPRINDRGYVNMRKARHPLIPREVVVPVDVELGGEYQAIVVTGPNTGGKTVSLKTIGLLSLMTMAGLHIPAEEESEMTVFSSVFADIGDEQSIEQSLSTFSSHMTNIIQILAKMDDKSLVLFDELGAGTDPTEGAALAMSIIDHVIDSGARLVATTHYSELKAYAYDRPEVINASVEFDVQTLRPTYRLLIGVPGRSNAFAIARRLGLPEHIIDVARGSISEEDNQVESMIASLERNRKSAEADRLAAKAAREEAEVLRRQLEEERAQFAEEKNKRMERAEDEARIAVQLAKEEAETIIRELREMMAEGVEIKEHRLIDAKKRLGNAVLELEKEKVKKPAKAVRATQIKVGDEVMVTSFGQKGTVLEKVNNEEFLVQIGIMKMKVKRDDMHVQNSIQQKPQAAPYTSVKRRSDNIKMDLDLRGYNVEDSIREIDQFLDDALLAGLHSVSIIHGHGTGVLRKGVHEYLRNHRNVKSFRLGGQGEGGVGATIAELK